MTLNRRQLLLSSLTGGAALLGIGYVLLPSDKKSNDQYRSGEFQQLSERDRDLLCVLAPVMLAGYYAQSSEMPVDEIARLLSNIDKAIAYQFPRTQKELRQLFDLLEEKLGRVVMARIWSTWQHASFEQKNHFLLSWRDSTLDLLQTAYVGLHNLFMAAYWVENTHWIRANYMGPPVVRQ